MIHRILAALAMTLGLAGAQVPTTVILVRHAERATASMSDTDAGLSPAGLKRAAVLERVLADAHVRAIYTSRMPRTIQTAQPLAKRLNLAPKQIDDAAALVKDLKAHPGQTVLVVHHGNTLPQVMEALGISHPPAIADTQFDLLFIVTSGNTGPPHLLTLHYGDASP
jgi:broad specificity phosphatase PhoE